MPRSASAARPPADPHGDVRAARLRATARADARAAVAAALRAFREGAGISQEKLGERAGLHRTYVGGYERGERRLTVDAVGQILAALGQTWAAFGAAVDVHRPAVPRSRARRGA